MNTEGAIGLVFLLALLALVPGPSDLMVAGVAVRRGVSSAVWMTVGILVADLVFILVVVRGAVWMAQLFEEAGILLNLLSALILGGFGIAMIRSSVAPLRTDPVKLVEGRGGGPFAAGFGITFFDPKALAFYLGVLPGFFEVEAFGFWDVSLLIAVVSAVICVTKAFYAWLALKGFAWLPSYRSRRWLICLMGVGLLVFSLARFIQLLR